MRARLATLTHACGRDVTVAVLARIVRDLPRDGHLLQRQVLQYIAEVYNHVTEDDFRAAIQQARPEEEENLMTTLAEKWKAEGKAQGKVEGEATGMAKIVIETLEVRFGQLSSDQRQRVMGLSADALSRLNRQAVNADSLEGALADAANDRS